MKKTGLGRSPFRSHVPKPTGRYETFKDGYRQARWEGTHTSKRDMEQLLDVERRSTSSGYSQAFVDGFAKAVQEMS